MWWWVWRPRPTWGVSKEEDLAYLAPQQLLEASAKAETRASARTFPRQQPILP